MSGLDCLKETLRQGMAWHGSKAEREEVRTIRLA
jgi:hypothetical protein